MLELGQTERGAATPRALALENKFCVMRVLARSIRPGVEKQILFDKWSLRDVLGHLSAWADLTVESMSAFLEGAGEIPWAPDVDEFNEQAVNDRASMDWQDICIEFEETTRGLISSYNNFSADLWDVEYGPEAGYTASKGLQVDIDHYDHHLQEMLRELK